MNTAGKVIIGVLGLTALGAGGYFLWQKYGKDNGPSLRLMQDDDEGTDIEEDTSISDAKAQKIRNSGKITKGDKLDVGKKPPRTHLAGEPIAELKTTVLLPSGSYLVDRNKVLYYDGINKNWPSSLKGQTYTPESIKKKFIPMNYQTGELQPSDQQQYDKLLERYNNDIADLSRQWAKIKWPTIAFDGSRKKPLGSAVDDRNFVISNY